MSDTKSQRRWGTAQIAVAVVACLTVLYACQRYGPAVDNDTAEFFSAADSVVSGAGFIMTTRELFILWPPLHPLVLAFLGQVGINHVDASLLYNLVALCVTLVVGARLVTRLSGSPALGLLWSLIVAVAPDFFWIHTRALSEAPFLAYCTLALSACSAYLEEARPRHFAQMTIAVGLAWVERYAGMVFLPVFCTCLALAPRSVALPTRLKRSAAFGILAGLPMLPWVIRNLIQTHEFTGGRGSFGEFGMPAAEALSQSLRTIVAWFAPFAGSLISVLALAALIVTIIGCWTAAPTPRRASAARWLPLIGFPLVYLVFTDVININYEIDGLGPRQMLPALPMGWTLALLAGHRAFTSLRKHPRPWGRPASWVLPIMIGTYLWIAAPHAFKHARHLHDAGAGYYSTPVWQDSAILQAATEFPFEGELYSNDVYALYLFAHLRSTPMPRRPFAYNRLARALADEGRSIQVFWVRTNERNRLPVERMQEHVTITTLLTAEDGFIYRLDPR